jgi:orotate phosphoribosyltransferase
MELVTALAADREALLTLIAKLSFRLGDFTLASGAKSDYYIDCRTTTLDAEGGRLSGLVFAELIRQHAPQAVAVGGLTMGADPLVSNTASATAWWRLAHPDVPAVHGFLVRKALKTHGTGRQIEGYVAEGAEVVVVDDVCTTGGSTITAIEAVQAEGMKVAAVLCLVDREQGGRANIEAVIGAAPFVSVFTASDVRAEKLRLIA